MKAEVTLNAKGEQRLILVPEDEVDADFLDSLDERVTSEPGEPDYCRVAPYLDVVMTQRDLDDYDEPLGVSEMSFRIVEDIETADDGSGKAGAA